GLYALKWMAARADAAGELGHPVQCCFVGLAPVTGSLCALALLPYLPGLAFVLFLAGGAGTLAFALYRTGLLWQGHREPVPPPALLYPPPLACRLPTALVAPHFRPQSLGPPRFRP